MPASARRATRSRHSRDIDQLSLPMPQSHGHGGRRAGAGRKPGPNPRIAHRRRERITPHHPCHVTLRVQRSIPSIRSARFLAELESSLRESCERGRFRVAHYTVLRDHVHAIVEASSARDLACGMRSFGARVARAAHRVFRSCGAVLADRFHLHVLRTPREVRNALAYVLLNARRHAAKAGRALASAVRLDPASSGRWFAGWKVRTESPTDAPAVARARSWLLSVGWRKVGLIDPLEIPGTRA